MRGFLLSSAGVTCVAALSLPLALSTGARAATAAPSAPVPAAPAASRSGAGGTQSLPLAVLTAGRALGDAPAQGLTRAHVRPFSLLGVAWDDPDAELAGRVQVRTRPAGTHSWSRWRDVAAGHEHAPDPGSTERAGRRVRGATAPLWVGRSDGVQVRVTPGTTGGKGAPAAQRRAGEDGAQAGAARGRARTAEASRAFDGRQGTDGSRGAGERTAQSLPAGLRLELVDPGGTTGEAVEPDGAGSTDPDTSGGAEPDGPGSAIAPRAPAAAQKPPTGQAATGQAVTGRAAVLGTPAVARPVGLARGAAPRPVIVSRADWGADESLRESGFRYTGTVKAAFVHHTDSGNDYSCAEAASVVRGIYRYHVETNGWRDIGYNFLVDKCGTIYEGRAGGVDQPVMGAHTMGFNTDSTGIAVVGTFTGAEPPQDALDSLTRLAAWKLGLTGADPEGSTLLTSAGGNLFPKGEQASMKVISGHRDGYSTDCPGTLLYDRLGTIRSNAAALQGR